MSLIIYQNWYTVLTEDAKLKKFFDFFKSSYDKDGIYFYLKSKDLKPLFSFSIICIQLNRINPEYNRHYCKPILTFWRKKVCLKERIYKNINSLVKPLKSITKNKNLTIESIANSPPPAYRELDYYFI